MGLEVHVKKATNLINIEKFGKSDPYVTISFQGAKKKTQVINNELDPEWNEKFSWEIGKQAPSPSESLQIWVKDHETVGRNRLMGECTLLLKSALQCCEPVDYELDLYDHNKRLTAGKLFLTVTYRSPIKNADVTSSSTSDTAQVVSQTDANHNEITRNRSGLSNTMLKTKTKFQVRVCILEGKQLVGSNLNPICEVELFKISKQTQISKATSSPFWNEMFLFGLECTPLDFFEHSAEFKVKNSRAIRSSMLIGGFKLNIGEVYNQPQHSYMNKWLVLSSDVMESVPEITGYLKVSIAVLGPGDDIPDFSASATGTSDDVESNVLLSSGTQLRPATFIVDLYQAVDLPRMDSGAMEGIKRALKISEKKDLIDPYVEISFAGNKVASKVMYGEDNPRWNQRLYINFQFPSVCDVIQLTLKDWDRVSEDDVIAVANVSVPSISASGPSGFLPSFGPTWVNFYGAPREFSILDSNHNTLNKTTTNGCCYRGRVLMSVRTEIESFTEPVPESLFSDLVLRAQLFCRRRRFRLHATFLEATMVEVTDSPVEFEVSIGNFGNLFEGTFEPNPSSTPPTNAVFDGCQFYYLPWKDMKPAVAITCQWEDVLFRLETLNVLTAIIEKVKNDVAAVKKETEMNEEDVKVNLIDQFLIHTDSKLPEPKPGQQKENELDTLLRKLRTDELGVIQERAASLRERETSLSEVVEELECMLAEMTSWITEPQSSVPDIIIWLISGKKRIAYSRIPVHHVLYSPDEDRCGKECGKLQTFLLQKPALQLSRKLKISAAIRLKLWFGLEAHEPHWRSTQTDSHLTVLAETYENQVSVFGKWTSKGPTMTRPSWSDASGNVKLKKDHFAAPRGWSFDGDWFINPESSLKYGDDSGRQTYLEDVFENQNRLPAGPWIEATTAWTDIRGDVSTPRDEIELPNGWEWEDVWQADLHRAVDDEGWEYTLEATLGGYQPVEKTYHLCRRRRWIRQRKLVASEGPHSDDENAEVDGEDYGWEYSTLFKLKFHLKEKKMDLVRRRRWHRKLIAEDDRAPLVFKPASSAEPDNEKASGTSCPRLYLTYKECHVTQLRAYVYQARDLHAGDKTGLSDPYAVISFLNQSQKTEVMPSTCSPLWDQTLLFDDVRIYGHRSEILEQPPMAIMEIYDRDARGDDEFLGRAVIEPVVLDGSSPRTSRLAWHPLLLGDAKSGEVLILLELYFKDFELPDLTEKRGDLWIVPDGIRPEVQLTAVEILCWGVRNLKNFELSPISRPSVEFECGGQIAKTSPLKDAKRNPNFKDPVLYLEMMLPQEPDYMPPINIKVRDNRQFGRRPIVGTHVVQSLHSFLCHPVVTPEKLTDGQMQNGTDFTDLAITILPEDTAIVVQHEDQEFDWWSKYYASIEEVSKAGKYLEKGLPTLQVFSTELENVQRYGKFSDFLQTFQLTRGKSKYFEESNSVGELKGTLRVYPLTTTVDGQKAQRLLSTLPLEDTEKVLVRVYIVKAQDLSSKDKNGKADPYIKIRLGRNEVNNRQKYKPNTLCPVFGEMIEISGTLPLDKDLTVSVVDYDFMSSDDLIGETVIDLENRYMTKHRATCGLPKTYHTSGLNKWRDSQLPTAILENVCVLHNLPSPQYQGSAVVQAGNRIYTLSEFEKEEPSDPTLGLPKERLALHVLHQMDLLPEHVETRTLYNQSSPGLPQGKLTMWVDIFQFSQTPGDPVDITPRVPLKYELRLIIWNTFDVPLDETSAVSGDTMSDIYVKASLLGCKKPQKTDIHYRSMDGEGNFNWRMVFPFEYFPAENKMVFTEKEHFWSLDETEHLCAPRLSLQIWDNDIVSDDDFLGQLDIDFTKFPFPAKSADTCCLGEENLLKDESSDARILNLFQKKRIRGFWPCSSVDVQGERKLAGKLEMEVELLTYDEAQAKPAGLGRSEPNINPKLEAPSRPPTSFFWMSSPWKSFKFILWRKYKWYCITLLVLFFALLLIALFIYSFPEAVVNRIVN